MIGHLHKVIEEIERGWNSKRMLVVGDVMLDKYIWGQVGRISPEAPVPIVHAMHDSNQPGGAANVAMNLTRLGAQTTVVGYVGDDDAQKLLSESLLSSGVHFEPVQSPLFPTITKTRIISGRQQMLRLDRERPGVRPEEDQDRLLQKVAEHLPGCHAVVLSDYAKGVLTPAVCQRVIHQARAASIPVVVDPKSADFSRYSGATTICPNLRELANAAQLESAEVESLLNAGEEMVRAHNLEFLTVTMSEKGIALLRRDSHRILAPALARQVFDVSGAGDTVVAVLSLGLAVGLDPETAVGLANVAAGVVVGKVGTVPIEKHELLAALTPEVALNASDKVIARDDLAVRVSLWKQNGERVVFTNGCFDLLHVGHITLIERARLLGDRLVLAINSDASISALKGPGRPIVGESERARVLAALGAVDAVTIFDEPTPLELIMATRPDIIVKGGDYSPEMVVGAREVELWGGEVRIIPTVEGFSTTRMVEKSRMAYPEGRGKYPV